jgi:hypothetical protein
MSLLHPPARVPAHLAFLWPLIWVQVLLLRAAVRAAYGRGVKYHWCVGPNGRVYLYSIDWIPGQKKERDLFAPAAHASDRLAAACDGRALVPAYARFCAAPHVAGIPSAARPIALALAANLPLPET